jgi:hypothetical protein
MLLHAFPPTVCKRKENCNLISTPPIAQKSEPHTLPRASSLAPLHASPLSAAAALSLPHARPPPPSPSLTHPQRLSSPGTSGTAHHRAPSSLALLSTATSPVAAPLLLVPALCTLSSRCPARPSSSAHPPCYLSPGSCASRWLQRELLCGSKRGRCRSTSRRQCMKLQTSGEPHELATIPHLFHCFHVLYSCCKCVFRLFWTFKSNVPNVSC